MWRRGYSIMVAQRLYAIRKSLYELQSDENLNPDEYELSNTCLFEDCEPEPEGMIFFDVLTGWGWTIAKPPDDN